MKIAMHFAVWIVAASGVAAADEVTDWNRIMLDALVVPPAIGAPLAQRPAAIVQAAVFDAVNGIERRYTPIHVNPAAPAGASSSAAAMQAAYSILTRLYGQGGVFTPNQQATLDADLAASLARIAMHDRPPAIASGRAWGQTVADAIWTWRSNDGFSLAAPTWVGSETLGQWRPTPNDPYPSPPVLGRG